MVWEAKPFSNSSNCCKQMKSLKAGLRMAFHAYGALDHARALLVANARISNNVLSTRTVFASAGGIYSQDERMFAGLIRYMRIVVHLDVFGISNQEEALR